MKAQNLTFTAIITKSDFNASAEETEAEYANTALEHHPWECKSPKLSASVFSDIPAGGMSSLSTAE